MNWDMIFMGSVILTCTTMGIIIGAWFAARGFEKALISLMKDYNEKEG
jgi:uncharacterized protein YneF (UPF0154 family)